MLLPRDCFPVSFFLVVLPQLRKPFNSQIVHAFRTLQECVFPHFYFSSAGNYKTHKAVD